MQLNKEISDQRVVGDSFNVPPKADFLTFAILGTAIGLGVLVIAIAVFWGSGPVLVEVSWYIPLVSAFIALTSLSVSYLALGRYQVLRDPISFWVGSGFAVYSIGQIFYALTWPHILPNGASILGRLGNTPALIALVDLTLLNAFLIAAILMKWPGPQNLSGARWVWVVVGGLLIVVLGFSLLVVFEAYLPGLVTQDGRFTLPQRIWVTAELLLYAAGSILSGLYYRRHGDRLAAYIAFPQLALVFISMMVLIGGKRYDLWWYLQRVVLVGGYLVVLFGLLSEYMRLLRRESEGRRMLNAILENVPVGLTVTGGPPNFPLREISRYGFELSQRPREGLLGLPSGFHQDAWRIFLPDGVTKPAPEEMPLYRASRFGEEVRNVELLMEAQDGRRIPLLLNAAPIRDAQGKVVAAINTWVDITDRKRLEEILRQSEAFYRAIARSIPRGGIFVVDKNRRYLVAEGTIAEKFGLSRDMIEGRSLSEIFAGDPELIARMEARFQRVFAGETVSYETEHNGHVYWSQIVLMNDSPGYALLVTLDITERKQAEQALQQLNTELESRVEKRTAELQTANQALLESRERLQTLSQRLVEVQEEERRAIARELHDSVGQTLAALNINLIIMDSQLGEETKKQLGSRMSDSTHLLSEAITLVRSVMTDLRPAVLEDYGVEAALQAYISDYQARYGITVHFDHANSSIPRLVPGIEMTLLRIAQEALANVARHAQTDQVMLSLHMVDGTVQLKVQDHGVGMDAYDSLDHPKSHGLKIMRERAEAFGGTVTVRSAVGEGTVVEAFIPIQESQHFRKK